MNEFYSLLPKNSSELELAIEQAIYKIHTRYTEVLNYRTVTKTHPLLLDWLALDNGLLIWDKLWSNEFKRNFLKTYLRWQQHAAQKNTLLDITNYFGFSSEITVWYDKPQTLPPYTFLLQLRKNHNNNFVFNDKLNVIYELVKAFKALRDDFYISFINTGSFAINSHLNYHKAQVQTSSNLYSKNQLNNTFSINLLHHKIERSRHRWVLPPVAQMMHVNMICNVNYNYIQHKIQRHIAHDIHTTKHNYLPLSTNIAIHFTHKAIFFAQISKPFIADGRLSEKFTLHNNIFKTQAHKYSINKDTITKRAISTFLNGGAINIKGNVKKHHIKLNIPNIKNILSYLSTRYYLTKNTSTKNTISSLHSKKGRFLNAEVKIFRHNTVISRHESYSR